MSSYRIEWTGLQQELAGWVQIPIIFITGHGDIPMTVRAMKAGPSNFSTSLSTTRTYSMPWRQAIHRGRQIEQLTHTARHSDARMLNTNSVAKPASRRSWGKAWRCARYSKKCRDRAPTDSTVLIYGETGTGKGFIARAIHHLSRRSSAPSSNQLCRIPTGLLESELFGHEKGAFTSAIAQRVRRLSLPTGHVFLDEKATPLEFASQLLRVLQDQEFERLGSAKDRTRRCSGW